MEMNIDIPSVCSIAKCFVRGYNNLELSNGIEIYLLTVKKFFPIVLGTQIFDIQ